MERKLQGIALILFGILFMLVALIDPYIPIIGDISFEVIFLIGLLCGIWGLVLNFKKDK